MGVAVAPLLRRVAAAAGKQQAKTENPDNPLKARFGINLKLGLPKN